MYKILDWKQSTNKMILDISLVPNVGLILSIGYRFKNSGVLSWIYNFAKLFE